MFDINIVHQNSKNASSGKEFEKLTQEIQNVTKSIKNIKNNNQTLIELKEELERFKNLCQNVINSGIILIDKNIQNNLNPEDRELLGVYYIEEGEYILKLYVKNINQFLLLHKKLFYQYTIFEIINFNFLEKIL